MYGDNVETIKGDFEEFILYSLISSSTFLSFSSDRLMMTTFKPCLASWGRKVMYYKSL